MPEDKKENLIVSSTIELIHGLGLQVIVEGVETQWQLDFIKQLPCDLVQGFLLSKPLSKQALLTKLKR